MVDTAVILTGGKSSRMGTDKALLNIGENTFLEEVYNKFKPYFQTIIMSLAEKGKYDHLNLDVLEIEDIIDHIGPLGGVYSVFQQTDLSEIFVVSVDTPLVNMKAVSAIIELCDDSDICIIEQNDLSLEPLFGVYKRSCIKYIEELISKKNYSMHRMLGMANLKKIPQSQIEEIIGEKLDYTLVNLNTKEDYSKYIKK